MVEPVIQQILDRWKAIPETSGPDRGGIDFNEYRRRYDGTRADLVVVARAAGELLGIPAYEGLKRAATEYLEAELRWREFLARCSVYVY
jgi:hypothetical protein